MTLLEMLHVAAEERAGAWGPDDLLAAEQEAAGLEGEGAVSGGDAERGQGDYDDDDDDGLVVDLTAGVDSSSRSVASRSAGGSSNAAARQPAAKLIVGKDGSVMKM